MSPDTGKFSGQYLIPHSSRSQVSARSYLIAAAALAFVAIGASAQSVDDSIVDAPVPPFVAAPVEPQGTNHLSENSTEAMLMLQSGELLNVIVKNIYDREIFLPAAPDACAVVAIERRLRGAWGKWSDCELRRRIENPIKLAPGQAIIGIRHLRGQSRISNAETYDGSLSTPSKQPTDGSNGAKLPSGQVPVEIEVQQTIIETPPVPFFERFRTLPAGEYQLAASYAFSERPGNIRFVRSPPFVVMD